MMFVRLSTLYEGADRGLDVLWKDLAIRAESLPRDPGQPSDRAFLRAPLAIVACMVLFVAVVFMERA